MTDIRANLGLDEAARKLGFKSGRALNEWLRENPFDPRDPVRTPLFRKAGREKVFTEGDLTRINAVLLQKASESTASCRLNSSRHERGSRRSIPCEEHTSASILTEALALATGRSRSGSLTGGSETSKVVSLQTRKRRVSRGQLAHT